MRRDDELPPELGDEICSCHRSRWVASLMLVLLLAVMALASSFG